MTTPAVAALILQIEAALRPFEPVGAPRGHAAPAGLEGADRRGATASLRTGVGPPKKISLSERPQAGHYATEAVRAFLSQHAQRLSGLTRREVGKHLG